MKTDQASPTDSDSFCYVPWTEFFVKPSGVMHPCCMSQLPLGQFNGQPLLEAWNTEEYKALRRAFLAGERPSSCHGCYAIEKAGGRSKRQAFKQRYHLNQKPFVESCNSDGSVHKLNLRYLDLRWSNLCNFRCRFCSVEWSSSWLNDHLAINGQHSVLNEELDPRYQVQLNRETKVLAPNLPWEEIERQVLPHVEHICFAGGEPLIQPQTYRILKSLIRLGRTDVSLSFVTNLSHFGSRGEALFEQLREFSLLDFTISVDGIGPRYEYLRKGGSWPTFEQNVFRLKQLFADRAQPTDSSQFFYSVYASNVFHAVEAIPALETRFETRVTSNLSFSPASSRIDHLPEFIKNPIRDLYRSESHPELTKIIKFMDGQTLGYPQSLKMLTEFLVITQKLDKLRSESFTDVFPEWRRYIRPDFIEEATFR